MREKETERGADGMLDDFILNDSYDAWDLDFEEAMDAWEEFCKELAQEKSTLTT